MSNGTINVLGVLSIAVIVLGCIFLYARGARQDVRCKKTCIPHVGEIIKNQCHCMDIEKRWVAQPDSGEEKK